MTWDERQAERVKRANAAPYTLSTAEQQACSRALRRSVRIVKRPNGNRAVSLIVAALGAACAFGMLAAIWHARGLW